MAVLSQPTIIIRLYGIVCNRTDVYSIDQLDLTGTDKVRMGVWQETNRQATVRLKSFGEHSNFHQGMVRLGWIWQPLLPVEPVELRMTSMQPSAVQSSESPSSIS